MDTLTLKEAADQTGVKPATLKRWAETGVIPDVDGGGWTPAAVSHARLVARLRERGHSLQEIREAAAEGRLAYGYIEDLFPEPRGEVTVDDAARETGLEKALIERIWASVGFPSQGLQSLTREDMQ